MNSSSNSDSKQCSESKLGQVHSMHTHGPGCAHAARWAGRIALCRGLAQPYRGLAPGRIVASAWSCRSVHRPCCVLSRTLSYAQSRAVSERLPSRVTGPLDHVAGLLGRVVASPRPYRRAVSWPSFYTPLSPVSRYNALYHDQVQKWAVAQPHFLHCFIFFYSCYWKNYPKKYLYTHIYIYIYIYIYIFQ